AIARSKFQLNLAIRVVQSRLARRMLAATQEDGMPTVIQNMSNELAGVVETAGSAVVRVEGRRRLSASGIVWSKDGVIVTAHHVLERDDGLSLGFGGEEKVTAELVGRDPGTDLAVLRSDQKGMKPGDWIDADSVRVGHLVLALGRPGRTVQATLGIVSALGTSWRTAAGGMVDRYLQTDVVMYPGFSGGPLVNVEGKVLGLNTSALRGVSLAIPTSTVRRVVDAILAHGKVRRGYLGVGVQPVRLPQALAKELGQETGLILVSVEPGSPADKGGLLLGDSLLSVDGAPVRQLDELLDLLSHEFVDREVVLRILRAGGVLEQKVRIGERE
ncbi:MAG: trypsin-like peptidase domain-containing protein, partial [Chloroflexota bacterium]